MWSDGKMLNIKVLRFFETNNFGHYTILIRGRFLSQNRPAKYKQVFDRTILESSDPPIRIRPKLGFWTWIQPSLLHTIAKTNLQTSIFSLSPLFSAHRSSVFFVLESFDLGSLSGGRTDLGQPITVVRPDGVSPGRVGFRVFKRARRIVLRIALPASLLRRRVLRIALDVGGTRWRVRVRTIIYHMTISDISHLGSPSFSS
jgi:hypothetical protein